MKGTTSVPWIFASATSVSASKRMRVHASPMACALSAGITPSAASASASAASKASMARRKAGAAKAFSNDGRANVLAASVCGIR